MSSEYVGEPEAEGETACSESIIYCSLKCTQTFLDK